MDVNRGQLRWRCRRGNKELDLLLQRWLEHEFESATPAEQQAFVRLLELPDPDLLSLLLGRMITDDHPLAELARKIRAT